jgi:predicted chitinase
MELYNPGSPFRYTSEWNPNRTHPVTGVVRPHRGEDWAAPSGTPIPAAGDGKVAYKGNMAGYGNLVVIEHANGTEIVHTLYAHMSVASPLAIGSSVAKGSSVGSCGNTGIGTGAHLHFEVLRNGKKGQPNLARGHATVNPREFDIANLTHPDAVEVTSAAPAPAALPATVSPVINFQYPFRKADGKQFANAEEIYNALENETSGHYLLGGNQFWHGGIHISDRSAPHCKLDEPIRCIADGEVVAYRINEDYLESTFGNDEKKKLKYSTSFCLVKHEYKSEANPEEGPNKGKQNTLTFYSLYMHLLPYKRYPLSADEIPKTKVTMKVGDFKAYDNCPESSSVVSVGKLSTGTKLEVLEQQRVGHVTYAKGKILSGSVKNGSHNAREAGREVWFAYLKDSVPYRNSKNQRIWLADLIPERTRPNYWQGKVKATAVNKLDLYGEPAILQSGQAAGPRMGPLQLIPGSVVEFDSQEVLNLNIDGVLRRMAKCTKVSGDPAGAGVVPSSFWACVENSPDYRIVEWSSLTPDTFDSVKTTRTAIKAGDPVGYLGLTENLTGEEGGVVSKHQVHVEVFTADGGVEDFLKNTAGLKTGKQYLHLPLGTELKAETPAPTSIVLTENHTLDVSQTRTIQVGGDDCYRVSLVTEGQTIEGLIKKTEAQIITQHDWEKLGFQVVKENNPTASGFLDPENVSPFFKDLMDKIDTNHNGDLDAGELTAALKNPALRAQWSKLIAYHPTEWKGRSDSPKWSKLNELLEHSPKTLKHEQERIDNSVFWDELGGDASIDSGVAWHFNPLGFVKYFSLIQSVELDVENFRKIFGDGRLFTAQNMPSDCDAYDVDPKIFIQVLNSGFKNNGFSKNIYKIHFLAQCYHESDRFRTTKEYASGKDYDLSTHPESVCITQGATSRTCKRHHQIVQSGNTSVGDGPKYKGKGLIQITWKSAYEKYKEYSGVDCVADPEIICRSIAQAVNVSFWFWTKFKGESLNQKIDRYYRELKANGGLSVEQMDAEVVRKVTKIVNGGSNHLEERQALFKKIKRELG